MSDEDIEHWLYLSGLMAPSVEALRPDFPRWRRYLGERGVTEIRSPLSADPAHGAGFWLMSSESSSSASGIAARLAGLRNEMVFGLYGLCVPG